MNDTPAQDTSPQKESSSRHGWLPDLQNESERLTALEEAFDYRGDVTITTSDNKTIEGYIFDRRTRETLKDSYVRILPKDSNDRLEISFADITSLQFSGKDAAHGRSWESWIARYIDKKSKGETASLEPEKLD